MADHAHLNRELYTRRSPCAAKSWWSAKAADPDGGESRGGYAVRMRDSPLPPRKIRMAAGAYAELGPEYSAAVASSLERVEQEIAAGVGARLVGMG